MDRMIVTLHSGGRQPVVRQPPQLGESVPEDLSVDAGLAARTVGMCNRLL